ncbi:MAG: hypothetical protein IKR41_01555 [Bacteroidales bacterium]|nr:hypothetical protein [Bacteroidales bacterium]
MLKKIFFCLVLLTSLSVKGQVFTVSGIAKTYAGDTLKMYVVDDYITKNESLIASAKVDSDGNFTFSGNIKDVKVAYIDLTVFKGRIFLGPNLKEEIVLPEKQQITLQDKLNPYFKKAEFFVKVINQKDKEDLNLLIPEFEKYFNSAMGKVFYSVKGVSKATVDSMENVINQKFTTKNQYFNDYKKYRYALLDYTAYHRSKDDIVKELFTGKEILINSPAYAELFDELFTNVFTSGKTSAIVIKDLYQGIYDKSYNTLKRKMMSEPKVGGEKFADYLILKGLKDSYYSDSFPKESLVAVADSVAMMSKTKDFRQIAAKLSEKFTTLLCGYAPPEIFLRDDKGLEYSYQKSSGKFVYLTFYNPNSYAAYADLDLLKQIRKGFPEDVLEIVMIFVSDKKEKMTEFLKKETDVTWKVLWYGFDNELLKSYNVRAFPVYYMLNPQGKLSMNPAPSPQEDFVLKFNAAYRNWKNDQYRQQYRENQGIK